MTALASSIKVSYHMISFKLKPFTLSVLRVLAFFI
jgi:hypothetical protein